MCIGIILNVLDEDYQIAIYRGIKHRAAELGVDLFCIQQENHHQLHKSLVSYFPNNDYFNLKGLICLTSVMADIYEINNQDDVHKIFGDLPIISVGQKIEGVPSIITQTDFSMKQMVEHLILTHNYRKFVFFSGPANHPDAISREEIFKKTMEAYKPWYNDLSYTICHGLFTEAAAIDLMTELYNANPNEKIDAVVCSNDNMAIGVYKFFKMNRQKKIFKECAVTGFDDIPQLRYNIPSITTVHQPLEEIGRQSLDNILKLIKKETVPELSFIESKLIIRESCGCKINHIENKNIIEDIQSEYIKSEQLLRLVSRFGQDASNSLSFDVLRYFIKTNIEQLDVEQFAILLFDKSDAEDDRDKKLKIIPFYIFKRGCNVNDLYSNTYINFDKFLKNFSEMDSKNSSIVFKYLISGNESLGCVLYNCADDVNPYLCTLIVTISQAISRINETEEKRKRSEYLEMEVEKRTHELIEANNRRMEVEAEVLKISEMERQRFSNDLHDDICQRLAGISMLCRSYSNQNKAIEKSQMVELAELITDTLQTTRQYAHNSFPVELNTLGLNDSINNLCVSFEKQSEIKCEYEWNVEDSVVFDTTQKLNIFRIIQEALHNIMKHAHAKTARVSVIQNDSKVLIQVSDDGCGLPEKKGELKMGLGVNSMEYRANQIGAVFEIKRNNPKGTNVFLELEIKQ